MNQDLDGQIFSLTPDASQPALEATLARLLVPGSIMDSGLSAHCTRLQDRFYLFSTTCPVPQWHEGLIITPEIRCQTEIYLPLAEIQAAFRYLLRRACYYSPFLPAVPIFSALSWADALERIHPSALAFNPAQTFAAVAEDQALRIRFLAAFFVPKRYGNGVDRYPLQKRFLEAWLLRRSPGDISILDAACGPGEGVYDLATLAVAAGFHPDSIVVHGCTVEPLELVAAAHGWFPHDSGRERSVKGMIAGTLQRGGVETISFFREDICQQSENRILYDVVVCNGLLGGPLLHEKSVLEAAVRGLVQRVKKGGLLLAVDRFHVGWRRVIPLSELKRLLAKHGLNCIDLAEGVGGIRT